MWVESFDDVLEDIVDISAAFDGIVVSFLFIIIAQRRCLFMVDLQTFGDSVDIVVGASALLASFNHSVDKLVLRNFETYDGVYVSAVFGKHLGERLCLRHGAWETVEDDAFFKHGGVRFEKVGEYVNHKFVGDEQTFGDECVGYFAELCSFCNVVAQKITRRDVVQTVAIDESFALSPLPAAGSSKNNNVHVLCISLNCNLVQASLRM